MMSPAATTAGIGSRGFPGISLCTHRRSIPPISAPGGRHTTATATATAGITYLRSTEAVGFSGATRTTTVRRAATHAAWPTGPPAATPAIITSISSGPDGHRVRSGRRINGVTWMIDQASRPASTAATITITTAAAARHDEYLRRSAHTRGKSPARRERRRLVDEYRQRRRIVYRGNGDRRRGRDGRAAVRHRHGERIRAVEVGGALISQGQQGRVELCRRAAEGHVGTPERPGRYRGPAGQGRGERTVGDAQRCGERPAIRVADRHPGARPADFPDRRRISAFSHVKVTRRVHRHGVRAGKLRRCSGAIQGSIGAGARQRRHHACRADLPNPIIALVGDIDVTLRVHGHGIRSAELRRRAAAFRVTLSAAARQRRHHARGGDLPDITVGRVRHVDVARRVHCHAIKTGELRRRASAIYVTTGAAARERRHASQRDRGVLQPRETGFEGEDRLRGRRYGCGAGGQQEGEQGQERAPRGPGGRQETAPQNGQYLAEINREQANGPEEGRSETVDHRREI